MNKKQRRRWDGLRLCLRPFRLVLSSFERSFRFAQIEPQWALYMTIFEFLGQLRLRYIDSPPQK